MSVKILMKNVEVYNNAHNESHGPGFGEHEQVANLGSKKIVYKKIFMIMSWDYKYGIPVMAGRQFQRVCGHWNPESIM